MQAPRAGEPLALLQEEASEPGLPVSLLEVREQPLPVHHVEQEEPSGLERARHALERLQVVGLLVEVAEGGEEIDRCVEPVAEPKVPHILSLEIDVQPHLPGLATSFKKVWDRVVHPRDLHASFRQQERMPADPAAEVQEARPFPEPQGLDQEPDFAGCRREMALVRRGVEPRVEERVLPPSLLRPHRAATHICSLPHRGRPPLKSP